MTFHRSGSTAFRLVFCVLLSGVAILYSGIQVPVTSAGDAPSGKTRAAAAPPVKPAVVAPDPKPLSPQDALSKFVVPDDLELELVLSEPVIAQPLQMSFDERGRMWLVQYLQYPFPAGLKILSEDKFLRAVYDKVPLPPPNHVPGKDKITIHEDTDGDGVFDKHKTFIDGLNIVSACAKGRGGVWVLNPPYLLFYPDRNNDDVPDGDPEVHLEGFGLEDTHSVVNSLRFGPDGWLYAAQGSTVSGNVKRPKVDKQGVYSMGQLVWRYHPEKRLYEIFAEGGGNAFGLELDAKGRIFSGHNGGDTRGFYYTQGAYLQKGFNKHGPLSNPFAFGYFPAMRHPNVPRFTHTFVIYEGGALPAPYQGKLFAVAPLQGHVVEAELFPEGSTFQTKDIGHPVTTSDKWFRPVDIKVGPDGAIYVADWYEAHIAHLRHHEGKIDTSNGRIYRLKAKGTPPQKPFDFGKLATADLIPLLEHPNKWQRQTALRLLGDRKDASAIPALKQRMAAAPPQTALESLWALNLCGGLNAAAALEALNHADPFVRLWTVRLMADPGQVPQEIARKLEDMAYREPSLDVRVQLACSARRLPAADGLPIVRKLLARSEDAIDLQVPLLLWWAIEANAERSREAVAALFEDPALWRLPIVEKQILHRLMQRYAATGQRKDLLICARLLQLSPGKEHTAALMRGFEEAFKGRSPSNLPRELVEALAKFGGASDVLALRQKQPEAVEKSLKLVGDDKADSQQRLRIIEILGEVKLPQSVPILLQVAADSRDDVLRMAALTALQQYDVAEIGGRVVQLYPKLSDDVRSVALTLLVSRKVWAAQLLAAVAGGQLDKGSVPLDFVRRLTAYRDPQIAEAVRKQWGAVEGATTAEMQQQIARMVQVLNAHTGDRYKGKKLFVASCAKCHTLFGLGGKIGPDLTSYKRDDIDAMLVHIVNPSAEIREGFETYLVVTQDGRTVTGFLVDRDPQLVVLRGADGQNISIAQNQIDEMLPQRKSLMPEGVLKDLTDQQVCDLFAYLRSTQPLAD